MDRARQGSRSSWRRRPPWWPAGEPWPPGPGHASQMRGRFLRRIAFFIGAFLIISLAANIAFWLFGGRDHGGGWNGPPFAGIFLLLLVGAFALTRFVRRTAVPVGDVMEAAGRLADGDYEARVRPSGPAEVQSLGLAFNAMADRLQANEAQRRDLLADIAHELRTPLSVIRGNAEAVVDGVYPADAEHLAPIIEGTEVMARLLDDLRTLSTAEAGTLSLHREAVAAGDLVADAVAAFRARAATGGVVLTGEAADGLPLLDVDRVRIGEVLANLLTNALRYTPSGGAVNVRAAAGRDASGVTFEVRDSGSGIPADELADVFTRFRKSEDSRGSGLGLAIAKSLVEAHGGTIEVESEVGAGTSVRFDLPVDSR